MIIFFIVSISFPKHQNINLPLINFTWVYEDAQGILNNDSLEVATIKNQLDNAEEIICRKIEAFKKLSYQILAASINGNNSHVLKNDPIWRHALCLAFINKTRDDKIPLTKK